MQLKQRAGGSKESIGVAENKRVEGDLRGKEVDEWQKAKLESAVGLLSMEIRKRKHWPWQALVGRRGRSF